MDPTAVKKEPVVIVFAILAGLQVIAAGLGLTDVLSEEAVDVIVLVIAALQAAAAFYVRGMVAPWHTVITQLTDNGQLVYGPASGGNAGPAVTPPEGPTNPPSS